MTHTELHQALATTVVDKHGVAGVSYALVRLQRSKADIRHSLHAEQTSWNLSGRFTEADLLQHIGFVAGPCSFVAGQQCLAAPVAADFDIRGFANTITRASGVLREGLDALQACGFFLERQLLGKGGMGPLPAAMFRVSGGDGHNAAKKERLKESQDDSFRFVLTFIDGPQQKGWTIHYIPKHQPVSIEVGSMLKYLGLRTFSDCPEAEFEPCIWRFLNFVSSDRVFDGPAEIAHGWFGAHAEKFSTGIAKVLEAEAVLSTAGFHLIPDVATNVPMEQLQPIRRTSRPSSSSQRSVTPHQPMAPGESVRNLNDPGRDAARATDSVYDVAISFAGPQRDLAEALATRVRDAGFEVFYDNFYPEHLWGKDLAVFFDDVYRKRSRYCVIVVSKDYVSRAWTNHERRSAVARMIESKGQDYILPLKVDDVELPGVQPTIGYLSLRELPIERVAELLIAKLGARA